MILFDFLKGLSYGEFSNLKLGNEGSGHIDDANVPKIIKAINEGLIRLTSRFLLVYKQLILEEQEHITNYHLLQQFAETSNSGQEYPYIKDLPDEPFIGDIIRILTVYGQDGCERPLNDEGKCNSLFTPSVQTLQIPYPVTGYSNTVLYQARHAPIEIPPDANRSQEIDIPFVLEGALSAFVAHKIYSNMNGQEHLVKSQEQLAIYEGICADVEDKDLVNRTVSTSTHKLTERGFV